MTWLIYIGLGICAGTLAGLFGVGGGLIIVPVLIMAFKIQGLGGDLMAHMAIGTSLATIVFTSLSSIQTHNKNKEIDWSLALTLSVGAVIGVWLGGYTADKLSGSMLQRIIGVFALAMAVKMAVNFTPKKAVSLKSKPLRVLSGGIIGWSSGLFGTGGGSLTVPFLTWCSVPVVRATAVSAVCSFPIALVGAMSYVVHGMGYAVLPKESLGYVYLPALIGISVASVPFARIGANLGHRLSAVMLKRAFSCYLLVVSIKLLFFPS